MTSSTSAAESTGYLTIAISRLRSSEGKVAVSIFAKERSTGFPDKGDLAVQTFYVYIPADKTVKITSKPLPYGEYAISLMHDQNGDGKFATTLFGIPKDGFGFSKNPRIFFGPPKFEACSFVINQEQNEVPIQMKYML